MIDLQRGDLFGVRSKGGLGVGIRFFEKLWSHDNEAEYNHTGLILDGEGTTFEALWKVKKNNLFVAYADCRVVIARPINPPVPVDQALTRIVKEYEGKWYPGWRIPLHMIPVLAKINFSGLAVCSELAAKYSWYLGIRHKQWASTNPDTLADEWCNYTSVYEIIFEDVI